MIEIYGVRLETNIDSLPIWRLVQALPPERQERIHRFRRKEDALRTLAADLLSRLLICSWLNIRNKDIRLTQNAYGKPLLEENSGLYFNNSHSGEWVVSAIAGSPVGIDVEKVEEIDFSIAGRFFSEQECLDLDLRRGEAKLNYFFDLWTLKESYIKAAGMGLSMPLDSFTVRAGNDGRIELTTLNEFRGCSFRQYPIGPGYKLSVCTQDDRFPDHIGLLSMDELHERFMTYV
ncbi:4'-phosphopantetheinyl transferase superfamily protein [Paenibacillus woosongensis]|uniref:4'-phosphopantetheinyl transferase superfamily protein n=1 Tax=Paenibacillus woosongensis TaxID=307580 RepID=A0AA95KVV6_9BACL|nr:4'-phosphopantetheinyl transferase superfamily protein [Paenibacillus woosongensis]WHX48940.1 4'-phosphopantetheinyl transferase superfamily protein [Paenibacillus woosongensis]